MTYDRLLLRACALGLPWHAEYVPPPPRREWLTIGWADLPIGTLIDVTMYGKAAWAAAKVVQREPGRLLIEYVD